MESMNSVKDSSNQMDPTLTDLVLNPKSNKIARPPNAFMIFAREHRKSFASQNPNQNNKSISKLLGEAWRKVDVKTKKMYYDKAKVLEDLHKQKFPDYAYSPRIARIQKMKRKIRKEQLKNLGNLPNDEREVKHEIYHPEEFKNDMKEEPDQGGNWSASPEYVPNNPDYFNSDPASNPADREDHPVPFPPNEQAQSSCRSSCSSLCSGLEMRPGSCPEFHACSCSSCWKKRTFESSYENPHSRGYKPEYMHSRNLELESFKPSLATQYPCYQKPPMSASFCPPNCYRNSFGFREPKSNNQSYYGTMPWQQYVPWKTPVEEDPYYYQNLDYYRNRNMNYCSANMPHRYPAFDHTSCYGANNGIRCMKGSGMQSSYFPPQQDRIRWPLNNFESAPPLNQFTNGAPSPASSHPRETIQPKTDVDYADSVINKSNADTDM